MSTVIIGEVQVWRPLPRHPGYQVNLAGQVMNTKTRKVLRPGLSGTGYWHVDLPGGNEYVHVLVTEAFRGPRPDGHQVGHRDGDRTNPSASNLRWVTLAQQAQDKRLHGTWGQRLTEQDVRAIRRSEESSTVLAARYDVSVSTVSSVRRGKTWAWVAA